MLINRHLLVLLLWSLLVPPAVYAEDTVKFGTTLTLTGSSAAFGHACLNGIKLATEDINRDGGIRGKKLEVLAEDYSETNLAKAVSAAQKLTSVDNVVALLPNWSEDAEVVAPIALSKKIVSFTLGAGGPGASRYSAASFRATTSDGELAKVAAESQIKKGAHNACLLFANTNYYVDIGDTLEKEWKRLGGAVVLKEELPFLAADTKAIATKVRLRKCDTIFTWSSPATIAVLTSELRQQKIKGDRILPWYADTAEIRQAAHGDTSSYYLFRWILSDPEFAVRYRQRFSTDLLRPAGNCYDGVRVLAQVMNKHGFEFDAVRQGLLSLQGYEGVTGSFIIQPDRERTGERFESIEIPTR